MAKVKIYLAPGETMQQAEDTLLKAMEFHNTGEVHGEEFPDPAMQATIHKMEEAHRKMYADMLREISEALDEEYSDGNQ